MASAYPKKVPDTDVPELGARIWDFWSRVLMWTETSRVGQDGCARVAAPEWEAYARLLGLDLEPGEWSIVFALDARYCGLLNEHIAEQQKAGSKP